VSFQEYGFFILWIDFLKINEKLEKLKELCKKEKGLFLQIEDYIVKIKDEEWEIKEYLKWHNKFKKWFYKKFITPYTAIIDLTQDEKTILAQMKQKGRYNIHLAEKKWVKIIEASKTRENIKIFYDLMLETTKRDNFHWNNLEYYFNLLNLIDTSKLLFADYEWKIISAWIFLFEKDVAIYYYWASTSDEKFRNLMSPYLLQWNAILIWKQLNCQIYDFLGIATPWDKHSSLIWITDFKTKFTQNTRKVSESYIWINKKWKYWLIKTLRKILKWLNFQNKNEFLTRK
jgi:lipid II:glycine glycyltransferase (peptidoglycan interpeptide bridge formation enzyme)